MKISLVVLSALLFVAPAFAADVSCDKCKGAECPASCAQHKTDATVKADPKKSAQADTTKTKHADAHKGKKKTAHT